MRSAAFVLGLAAVAALTAFDAGEGSQSAAALTAFDPHGGGLSASQVHDVAAQAGIVAVERAPAWQRPDGPVRVALQAGHWKAAEAPDEQARLRTNGTRGGGKAEWEVNLGIARHTARMLEESGYEVEILPTTIPPGYWADVFISIHADGNTSPTASGYRAAAPRRDRTGRAHELAALLTQTYGEATGLPHYPLITRRMRGYYAFNSRRYRHALHPMTIGVILETGFLTSPRDRRIIVDAQDRAARGIAEAVIRFVEPQVTEAEAAGAEQER